MKEAFKPDPDDKSKMYISDELLIDRHIVCAANKYGDLIICGARHHDKIMNSVLGKIRAIDVDFERVGEQGFIDQYGTFVTREDAKEIVVANKQPLRDTPLYDVLFSENIY